MKKIIQINSVINSGSTGRITEEIGKAIIANGWESYIAFGRNNRPSESHKIKIGNEWDVKWHGVQTRLLDNHGFASKKATRKLIQEIQKIDPDIIHLHNLHGYYINIEILFNFLAQINIPIVWTLHDCWSMTGHCSHFTFVKCEKWKIYCEKCPQKREYPSSFFLDNSYDNFIMKKSLFTSVENLTIVTVSQWLSSIVAESFLSKYQIKIISNGIDTNIFKPCNNEMRNKFNLRNKFILLGVANVWSQRKGFDDFVKLSNILEKDEIIILVGLEEKQIKLLPQNIIGIKRTEHVKELAELYSMADVVLNLSVEETFGMTTIEGFACGTPGIVYNCTASPELITPEVGFIVKQRNIRELRECLNIIKNKGKFAYSLSCRERAIKYYRREDKVNQYMTIYRDIL